MRSRNLPTSFGKLCKWPTREGQPPLQICSGELPTGWSASGDIERRLRRRGTPWWQPAWVGATGEGGNLVIGEMASATAGEANRTPCRSPTARNTAKDKFKTPRTASSCAESSTDTTATSTSTQTASPDDMATRGTGIILRAGAAGAGAGASGSCSHLIRRQICRLGNTPTDRASGSCSRLIRRLILQQRGTGQHHRRTRLDMDSRLTRGALARAHTATLQAGTAAAILP